MVHVVYNFLTFLSYKLVVFNVFCCDIVTMVKKRVKISVPVDKEEVEVVNENGKRPNDDENKADTKRLKTKSWFRQPTVNELNRLQETENLFNSNLFRLQVEEVLQEVRVKEKTEKKFQQWFTTFKDHLTSICDDDTEYDLIEQTLAKKLKVKIPINCETNKTKCVFKFHKFKDVEVSGSYALGCSINSKLKVDVQITVPAETYTKNDSTNYRYHRKRAAYLAYIASHLTKLETIQEVNYTWVHGSDTKPVIDIIPIEKLANHFTVRINLVCEAEAYKLHRFSPQRNNLREAWLFNKETQENSSEVGPPTPIYNSSVLSDLTASANDKFLTDILLKSDNLKQAIVLLKIWLRQRGLQVSGHVVSMFVAYLVQTKRINNIMSSYQIVRNVWIAWKTSEWDTKGISLHKGDDSPPIQAFQEHFSIVFLDTTGYYNLCYQMCKGTYLALKRECVLAVEMLDNTSINAFIPLFMVPVKPLLQFDHILKLKNLSKVKEAVLKRASKESRVNYGVNQLALVTDTLYSLLSKGLGNRVDLILQMVDADFTWPVKKVPEKCRKDGQEESVSFGFILNPENAINIVEKGPPANFPEAEEFRLFWGDKSELRRFQDGSITETCVWDADTLAERRSITKQIINYLMKMKYGIIPSDVHHVCDQLDSVTARKQYCAFSEESSVEALRAFDELRRDLRALTQLPLDVSAVYGVSPVFSYCDPLPPLPHAPIPKPWQRGSACLIKDITRQDGTVVVPEYTPVSKAIVELGHSGKWPGDIEAFRCLKAAFHLQVADRLTKQYSLPAQAYPTHVDVLKNGLVFRLEIAHPKEITLLRREMEKGVVKYRESEESIQLQCDTVLLPRLRGALHGLHEKYPAFGPTTCLLKRWLASHLLSPPHFPPVVVELLSAAVFLRPAPLEPPAQPFVGLLRVWKLLADTDWVREMLLLDFNQDMTREEITELERKFNEREEKTPYMYIVTSYDGDLPSVWSATAPTEQVVCRARVLARSALDYMEKALMKDFKDNVLAAFVPSLTGYDVIIHLQPHLVPYSSERVDKRPSPKALPDTVVEQVVPPVEFHVVHKYLEELRSAYSDFALFFHDCFGGEVIAVLWKPDIDDSREFQLTNANALQPIKTKGEIAYKINKPALVEDFRILGAGLVRDITVT
ncbi:nucleolar protein 6 [Hyposmocoma kahamanoa]|uniref:nucleolar protein 6 n=1 Tax=Hyposmocoma kahamanoa TaxID=1477025 RepID=UPI000E6D7EC4|nr:nucleolar protein 6 [Hyposmocoma kahamanoa]